MTHWRLPKAAGGPYNPPPEEAMLNLFVGTYITLFFLLTPFFVVSSFLSLTSEMDSRRRRRVAFRTIITVILMTLILYLFGSKIFVVLGITIDSFRIGGGTLLFLSAVALVKGNAEQRQVAEGEDVAIVPLALPITVGPGTTAALLVLGAEVAGEYGHSMRSQLTAIGAMLAAVLTVCAMIWASAVMDRFIPQRIMGILSKLTGLILASLSAQLIFTGIRNFMK